MSRNRRTAGFGEMARTMVETAGNAGTSGRYVGVGFRPGLPDEPADHGVR